ncbi:MAG: hypothetical protein WC867_02910 [Candidatus Pacearchaeota archaeon]|jgi:hypothetical protein
MSEQFLTRLDKSIEDIDFFNAISDFANDNGYFLRIQKPTFLSLPVQVPISVPEKVYDILKNDSPVYNLLMLNKLEEISDDKMFKTYFRDQILIRKEENLVIARNMLRFDEVSTLESDVYDEIRNVKRGSEFDRMDPFGKYLYELVRKK